MTTVAVMQPYFVPYAGYFRLFAAADVVVMFDCVQFPRRGWVHRNRLPADSGELAWLTLPVAHAAREARIVDLRFRSDAQSVLAAAMERFPLLRSARRERRPLLDRVLALHGDDLGTYLTELVRDLTAELRLERRLVRSSTLAIGPELHGQERVIAVARALGATRYVNPPGGRELYDPAAFAAAGIELRFLPPYHGAADSILARLLRESPDAVREEIERETALLP